MKAITIKEAINQVEERGQKVNFGTFQSIDDFVSYYNAHYLPLLQSLFDEQPDIDKSRLIGFLIEDLNEITNY